MKRNDYGTSFADTFLHRADHIIAMARIRLDLAAARQRVDRALLALGESTFKIATDSNRTSELPSGLDGAIEHVRRAMQDCDRLQERLDEVREKWREE